MRILLGFFLLGCVGMTIEVIFTALANYRLKHNLQLKGYSYIWMFPIYGAAYPMLSGLWPHIENWPIILRGLLYVMLFFAVEYFIGWLLRLIIGKCPWEDNYKGRRWSVNNLIRLDYTPAWFVMGLLFERLYLVIR